eukprot:TRINITY_DN214_c0_g1_i1.p1 TRINITY_DN214_c0_g1~~TRINITY_DN214_c0_g1_i1.p1  ORF type:complete len:512 (+),score=114.78 TRINITY_DN214_c0_g1_i1:51-1586(+)
MKQERAVPHIEHLPHSIMDRIYGFLDGKGAVALSSTSKRMRSDLMWKKIYFNQFGDSHSFLIQNRDKADRETEFVPVTKQTKWKQIYKDTTEHGSMRWKLNQVFGEDPTSVNEENVITSVQFDHTGEYLAIGYQCGQIVIFRNNPTPSSPHTFKFHTQFESHHPDFDPLTSVEVEEKISHIAFLPQPYHPNTRMLLSANDKTIKLWKIYDKQRYASPMASPSSIRSSDTPKSPSPLTVGHRANKVYSHAHAFNINSLTPCSDGILFLSSDDLRINLWDLENSKEVFTIVDKKPANMNKLEEVITSTVFHPVHSHLFAYADSRGTISMVDMRDRALCDQASQVFVERDRAKSFFSDVTGSISDLKFSPSDGRYLMSRDYLTLKVWDIRMSTGPACSFNIHDHLRPKLYELYENDCIFDKFEASWSPSSLHIITGSYSNNFSVLDVTRNEIKYQQAINPRDRRRKRGGPLPTTEDVNFQEKVLHVDWNPKYPLTAVAAGNYIYLYHLTTQLNT